MSEPDERAEQLAGLGEAQRVYQAHIAQLATMMAERDGQCGWLGVEPRLDARWQALEASIGALQLLVARCAEEIRRLGECGEACI